MYIYPPYYLTYLLYFSVMARAGDGKVHLTKPYQTRKMSKIGLHMDNSDDTI